MRSQSFLQDSKRRYNQADLSPYKLLVWLEGRCIATAEIEIKVKYNAQNKTICTKLQDKCMGSPHPIPEKVSTYPRKHTSSTDPNNMFFFAIPVPPDHQATLQRKRQIFQKLVQGHEIKQSCTCRDLRMLNSLLHDYIHDIIIRERENIQ